MFNPILDVLLRRGDPCLHLADLKGYAEAHARAGGQLDADSVGRTCKAVLNVAASGRFSSDRTIAEYAVEVWQAEPCKLA